MPESELLSDRQIPLGGRLKDAIGAQSPCASWSRSGGERQRAWLAMMLAQDASCLILDEPTSALDIAHQADMLALVRDLTRERDLAALVVLRVLLSALMTASAAMFVGPLSFIGLIAPHLARLLGLGRARDHLIGAVLLGAALMVVSDWLARMVAFPYQLPVGLFASLIGGPYLIYLLSRGAHQRG